MSSTTLHLFFHQYNLSLSTLLPLTFSLVNHNLFSLPLLIIRWHFLFYCWLNPFMAARALVFISSSFTSIRFTHTRHFLIRDLPHLECCSSMSLSFNASKTEIIQWLLSYFFLLMILTFSHLIPSVSHIVCLLQVIVFLPTRIHGTLIKLTNAVEKCHLKITHSLL